MSSGYTKEKLLKELKIETFSKLDEGFHYLLTQKHKEIQKKLSSALSTFDGNEEEALEGLMELAQSPSTEYDAVWFDIISEALASTPEQVTLEQEEAHYQPKEGDTSFIKIGKAFKRSGRSIYQLSVVVQNGFSRMLKKSERKPKVAIRIIPITDIVQSTLFSQSELICNWDIKYQKFVTGFLNELQVRVLKYAVDQEAKNLTEFIDTGITQLGEIHTANKVELATVLNSVEQDVSTILESVGTIELSEDKFTKANSERKKSDFQNKLKLIQTNWNGIKEHLSKRVKISVNVIRLKRILTSMSEDLFKRTSDFFRQKIDDPHVQIRAELENCIGVLKEANNPSRKELAIICSNIKTTINNLVESVGIEPLQQAIENPELSQYFEDYISGVPKLSNDQVEKTDFIKELDINESAPKYTIKVVDWQRFLKRMLGEYLVNELVPAKLKPEEFITDIISLYSEVIQIVETNLEVVEEVTRAEEETPLSIAENGLERTRLKIDEIDERITSKKQELSVLLQSKNKELFETLTDFLIKQDLSEIKWMEAQLMVKESAGDWKTKFTVVWAKLLDRFDLSRRFVTLKFNAYLKSTRDFFGIGSGALEKGEKTTFATFLHETDQKFAQLPFIYRRLFDFKREIDSSFFVKNSMHFETCKKALELWKGGFPASISIIGEKGSGKSTLIRFLKEEIFQDEKVSTIHIDSTVATESGMINEVTKKLALKDTSESVDELISKMKKNRKGSIVIVENIQNSFLRNMNGYQALETLLFIMTETKNEVLWLVSSSRYTWNFLDIVFKVGEYFSHSISCDSLTDSDIESVILKRQKASGYQLRFEADQSMQKSRTYKKFLDDDVAAQEYLQEIFFEKLAKVSEGNAIVAMIFWIRSIKEFSDSHFTIEPFKVTATERLEGLDSLSLFALNSFVIHDTLTAKELAYTLNSSERECQMIISRLSSRGILLQNKNKEFWLSDLIYRQVVRLLKLRNILH